MPSIMQALANDYRWQHGWDTASAHASAASLGYANEGPRAEPEKLSTVMGLVGWREMLVMGGGILASPQQECAFMGRISEPAKCKNAGGQKFEGPHKPPARQCQCGYFAMYKRADAHGWNGNALIKVSAIGETEMHEKGFRSAQFRIDEVYIHESEKEFAPALRERFGVDIFLEEEPCKSEKENSELSQLRRLMQDRMKRQITPPQQFPPPGQPLSPSPLGQFQPGGPLPVGNQFPQPGGTFTTNQTNAFRV